MKITNKTVAWTIASIMGFFSMAYPFIHFLFEEGTELFAHEGYGSSRLASVIALGIIGTAIVVIYLYFLGTDVIQFEYKIKFPWTKDQELDARWRIKNKRDE